MQDPHAEESKSRFRSGQKLPDPQLCFKPSQNKTKKDKKNFQNPKLTKEKTAS
jgi:hypothetical protein